MLSSLPLTLFQGFSFCYPLLLLLFGNWLPHVNLLGNLGKIPKHHAVFPESRFIYSGIRFTEGPELSAVAVVERCSSFSNF